MTMYGKAKRTELENIIKGQMQGELSGAGMYFALARAAKEMNLAAVAEHFTELAGEHAAQAAFYAEFCGRYPFEENEFWQFVKGLSKAEYFGETAVSGLADTVKKSRVRRCRRNNQNFCGSTQASRGSDTTADGRIRARNRQTRH